MDTQTVKAKKIQFIIVIAIALLIVGLLTKSLVVTSFASAGLFILGMYVAIMD